jgi:hypothetical protein
MKNSLSDDKMFWLKQLGTSTMEGMYSGRLLRCFPIKLTQVFQTSDK